MDKKKWLLTGFICLMLLSSLAMAQDGGVAGEEKALDDAEGESGVGAEPSTIELNPNAWAKGTTLSTLWMHVEINNKNSGFEIYLIKAAGTAIKDVQTAKLSDAGYASRVFIHSGSYDGKLSIHSNDDETDVLKSLAEGKYLFVLIIDRGKATEEIIAFTTFEVKKAKFAAKLEITSPFIIGTTKTLDVNYVPENDLEEGAQIWMDQDTTSLDLLGELTAQNEALKDKPGPTVLNFNELDNWGSSTFEALSVELNKSIPASQLEGQFVPGQKHFVGIYDPKKNEFVAGRIVEFQKAGVVPPTPSADEGFIRKVFQVHIFPPSRNFSTEFDPKESNKTARVYPKKQFTVFFTQKFLDGKGTVYVLKDQECVEDASREHTLPDGNKISWGEKLTSDKQLPAAQFEVRDLPNDDNYLIKVGEEKDFTLNFCYFKDGKLFKDSIKIEMIPIGLTVRNVWYRETAASDWKLLEGAPFYDNEISQRLEKVHQLEIELYDVKEDLNLMIGLEGANENFTANKNQFFEEHLKAGADAKRKGELKDGDPNRGNGKLFSVPGGKFNLTEGFGKLAYFRQGIVKSTTVLRVDQIEGKALSALPKDTSYKIFLGQVNKIGSRVDLNSAYFNLTIGPVLSGIKVRERELGIREGLSEVPPCKTINECLAQLGQKFAQESFK